MSAATLVLANRYNSEAVEAAAMGAMHEYLQHRLPLLPLNDLPASNRDPSCAHSVAPVFEETNWPLEEQTERANNFFS